ncbi:MAG TPA: VCBS repeat-containing protein, partial [Mycobacterium sp.]|nr:VCBS repeat-containing protein [Mycobacterium sp.]
VQVHDGNGDRVIETLTPFPAFEGTPSVTMADVNGDTVLDLVVGTGPGVAPEVVAYTGSDTPNGPFKDEITRFTPFDAAFRGGVNVAAADIDGNALADNIIVGSGPGMESQVEVFSSTLPTEKGKAPDVFSSFTPYPGSQSGVTVATGLVSYEQGRQSIVTAPGPGEPAKIRTYHYDLFTPTQRAQANGAPNPNGPGDPTMVSEFLAYDQSYTGGVSLSTGWVAGQEGGAQSIVTGQLAGDGTVRVWSSGSRLDGAPVFYTHSMGQHSGHVEFRQTASFNPFSSGVTVATTSTTAGADLLVSGVGPQGAEVIKFGLGRADPQANTLTPSVLTRLPAIPRLNGPAPLAGR